mmetsp:Transcript_12784/g.40096  ORF Transcript_12784/g.40096 Transcript_12784/m.40096 type:complete len:515 (+) Transcript_12784:118-1662(+)
MAAAVVLLGLGLLGAAAKPLAPVMPVPQEQNQCSSLIQSTTSKRRAPFQRGDADKVGEAGLRDAAREQPAGPSPAAALAVAPALAADAARAPDSSAGLAGSPAAAPAAASALASAEPSASPANALAGPAATSAASPRSAAVAGPAVDPATAAAASPEAAEAGIAAAGLKAASKLHQGTIALAAELQRRAGSRGVWKDLALVAFMVAFLVAIFCLGAALGPDSVIGIPAQKDLDLGTQGRPGPYQSSNMLRPELHAAEASMSPTLRSSRFSTLEAPPRSSVPPVPPSQNLLSFARPSAPPQQAKEPVRFTDTAALCPELVVPEECECTLQVPRLLPHLRRLGSGQSVATVDDARHLPMFRVNFSLPSMGNKCLVLSSATDDTDGMVFAFCKASQPGPTLEPTLTIHHAARGQFGTLRMRAGEPEREYEVVTRVGGLISLRCSGNDLTASDGQGQLMALVEPLPEDPTRRVVRIGPLVDAGLITLSILGVDLLEGSVRGGHRHPLSQLDVPSLREL